MLKPLKQFDSVTLNYHVCDIENRRNGDLLAIMTGWRGSDGEMVTREHTNWGDWLDFILHQEISTIYAHNGGGWDWLSAIAYFMRERRADVVDILGVMNNSKMILANFVVGEHKICLCDTLHLFHCSLDKIATKLCGRGKLKFDGDHETLYQTDIDRFRAYHRNDCELLLESLEKFTTLIHTQVAPIGHINPTLASTALRVFRCGFLNKPIFTMSNAGDEDEANPDLEKLCVDAYRGGRVECFVPGFHPSVQIYDINSLYPSVMSLQPVPVSLVGRKTKRYSTAEIGVYKIRFKQQYLGKPILMIGGDGAYSGEGCFYSPEIELLRRTDPRCEIEVIDGYVFNDCEVLFSDYVSKLYALRQTDKDGPLGTICKLLLNSLYGKFAQKTDGKSIVVIRDFDSLFKLVKCDRVKPEPINNEYGVWGVTTPVAVRHRQPAISGFITSMARVKLYEAFDGNTVYCDTDSVHQIEPFERDKIGSGLGEWKLEFSGEGVYLGKKIYSLKSGSETKTRAKGIRIKDGNLTHSDMIRLAKGGTKRIEYESMVTPRETFKGIKPCRSLKRNRTIRMTAK